MISTNLTRCQGTEVPLKRPNQCSSETPKSDLWNLAKEEALSETRLKVNQFLISDQLALYWKSSITEGECRQSQQTQSRHTTFRKWASEVETRVWIHEDWVWKTLESERKQLGNLNSSYFQLKALKRITLQTSKNPMILTRNLKREGAESMMTQSLF